MVKFWICVIAAIVLILGCLGWWIHYSSQKWERYKIRHHCVFSGETRETTIPQWISTGNGGGFLNYITVTENLFVCIDADGSKIKVWN